MKRDRVAATERWLLNGTDNPPGTEDLSRSATEQENEDILGTWYGMTPQQPQIQAPLEAYEERMEERQRCDLSRWPARSRVMHHGSAQGELDRRDDRFGVDISRGTLGRPVG